jgi:hypothetical protein
MFMVAVPYALLAFCGISLFVLYRKKVREEAQRASAEPAVEGVVPLTAVGHP